MGLPAGHDRLLDELKSHLAARPDIEDSGLLGSFAELLLRRADLGEPGELDLDTLADHVVSLLEFVDARRGEPFSVRTRCARNSRTGRDEWVLEVTTDDAPFLVESVIGELKASDMAPRRMLHPVIGTDRDADGRLVAVGEARTAIGRESVQHYELDRDLTADGAAALERAVSEVLVDLRRAVGDFDTMVQRVDRMIEVARDGAYHYSQDEVDESVAFLEWLRDDNFVFLGYREYRVFDTDEGQAIEVIPESGLGVLTDAASSALARPTLIADLPERRRSRYLSGHLLVISKTNRSSRVHRRARMDYIGVRHVGPQGRLVGEARLIGLFTAKAYMTPSSSIPVLRRKLDWIIESEDLIEGSHDYRSVVQIFDSFPKEELFSVPREEIARSITGLHALEERREVQLFVRSDLLRRNVSVMVALPKERFNAKLRRKLQDLILERFNGTGIDYRLALGESDTARIHFTVWVADAVPEPSFTELEADVVALTRTWDDRLTEALVAAAGPDHGRAMALRWATRFPEYYKAATPMDIAVGDVTCLSRLERDERAMLVGLQNETRGEEPLTRLSFYHRGKKLTLSEMMPVLEHLGLQVVEEVPTRLAAAGEDYLIHDFGVLGEDGAMLDIAACRDRVIRLIEAVWEETAESDSLSRLIISAGLDHRHVNVLRAYRTYWRRVAPHFTVDYVNNTLAAYPEIARMLIGLFRARFRPGGSDRDEAVLRADLDQAIDAVESLDEDRILRGFVGLITATARTNAYRFGRSFLAFKLRSAAVPDMPQPRPLFEIFVYAPEVEGVHLRGGRVARGGLRWSVRREDYRTEVLDLMKAQMVKNAVIVPTGAKGGFIVRRPPGPGDMQEAVRAAYATFIRGLLDLTDNLVTGSVVAPPEIRVHDEPDPYLVVAADKGTAALSDLANEVAAEYDFWLGDAFASGGSAGYDHKALGITARGAWESVKHHFHGLGVDVDADEFTAVGIGDMSGDVFGNGMLLSSHLRLVAAFDHRHVFVDPNPTEAGFAERRRLFALPASSWADYDEATISPGGGVFPRSAKRIDLSPQAREALGTERTTLTPHELIAVILRAPVDLLWNGGVGTYVKATEESHAEVGDRSNDPVRVDGRELRCRVVGEGGNLGFTQRGRIEYALSGGRINTDFIDNSGGVHCSDREVNLKVLLGLALERGELAASERNPLIEALAADVTRRVVYDNFLQAQILSQEQAASLQRMDAYEDLMVQLGEAGLLDRRLERLPSSDDMVDRTRTGVGLTTPELAVLLAYAKRQLSDDLLRSDLPDAPEMQALAASYFPEAVVERFGHLVADHPLRRDIIATVVANEVINSEGITFVARLAAETGNDAPAIVRAYRIARLVTQAGKHWAAIEDLAGKLDPSIQHQLLGGVDELVEATTRWYLARGEATVSMHTIEATQAAFAELAEQLTVVAPAEWRQIRAAEVAELERTGVPLDVARRHAYRHALVYAPDIIELARERRLSLEVVTRLSFEVAQAFQLDVLADRLAGLPRTDRWQRAAARAVGDDLLRLRRRLMRQVVDHTTVADPAEAVAAFVRARRTSHDRLRRLLRSVAVEGGDDVSALVVAVRRIENVIAPQPDRV